MPPLQLMLKPPVMEEERPGVSESAAAGSVSTTAMLSVHPLASVTTTV